MQHKIKIGDDPEQFNSTTIPFNTPNYNFFGRQGWICPKCGRVFSPDTSMCLYCNDGEKTTITTTTTTAMPSLDGAITVKANGDEDWLKTYLNNKMFYVDDPLSKYNEYLNYLNHNVIFKDDV